MFSTNFNMVLRDLKLSIANFCSVVNKQVQLETFITNNDIDIIIGTESHLNETILSFEIFPNNFKPTEKTETVMVVVYLFQLRVVFLPHKLI